MSSTTVRITSHDEAGDEVIIHWDTTRQTWLALRETVDGTTSRVSIPGRVMKQRLPEDVERIRGEMSARNKKAGGKT